MQINRLAILTGVCSVFAIGQGTLADYQRSAGLRDRAFEEDLHFAEPAQAINKANRFWYRRSTPGGYQFMVVDAATGQKSPGV